MRAKPLIALLGLVACGLIVLSWLPSPAAPDVANPVPSRSPESAPPTPAAAASLPHHATPPDPAAAATPTPPESAPPPDRPALGTANLVAAIETAFAAGDPARLDQAFTELMPALILQDAAAAGRLAAQVADAELRQDVLRLVARLWSAKDPAAAAAWAAALPADVEHDTALSEIASEVAATDAPRAVQLYALYARSAELSPTLETLAQQWADQNFGAALTWTLARPPSAQRESLLARLAFVQARTDPRAAATLATTHLAPGERQDEAVIAVLHQWAQLDPSAAASWVAAFPAGPLRDRASTELAGVSAYRVTRRPP